MTDRFMSAADFRAAMALLHERGISANELHKIFFRMREQSAAPLGPHWRAPLCGAGPGRGPAGHSPMGPVTAVTSH